MQMDLAQHAPNAAQLARFGAVYAAPPRSTSNPWEMGTSSFRAEHLKGLSAVLQLWKPAYEQDPQVNLAKLLEEALEKEWHFASLERTLFRESVKEVAAAQEEKVLRQVLKNTERDLLVAPPDQKALLQIFYMALKDFRLAGGQSQSVLVVNPDIADLARWTLENLRQFFKIQWCLESVTRKLAEMKSTGPLPQLENFVDLPLSLALEDFGMHASPVQLEPLLRFFSHRDAPIRESAMLGLFEHKRLPHKMLVAVEDLAVTDTSPGVRATALELLGHAREGLRP